MRGYAAKRDDNEKPIISALRAAGWSVFQMSAPGFPDLMCVRHGRVELVEVKMPTGKLTPKQDEMFLTLAAAGLAPHVVRSPEEALEKLSDRPKGAAEMSVEFAALLRKVGGR